MKKEKHYKVWCGGKGKVFATLKEAEGLANEIFKHTYTFVAVTETTAAVTHIYRI